MYLHSAYGLTIHSEVPLPEFRPGGEAADVLVQLGRVEIPAPGVLPGAKRWISGTADDLTIWWRFLGAVRIRGGRDVTVDLLPGVNDRTLRSALMGSVMGVLLLQRTPAVFHSSAVSMHGGAVAFMAHKGRGKSTTAAALYSRGYDLITDDLVVLDDVGDKQMVRTGFKEMKLWPNALEALGQPSGELTRVIPSIEKRARPLGDRLAHSPVPLKQVCLLAFGPEIAMQRLSPKEALFGVMPHWYGAQFQGELLPRLDLSSHLQAVRQLVDRAPVYRLTRPPDLKQLDAVAQCIQQHFEAATSARAAG